MHHDLIPTSTTRNVPVGRLLRLSALAGAAALAACSTTATVPADLVRARDTVQQASNDPNVLTYGALELKKATDALNRANTLSAQGDSVEAVGSAAYVALRHAQAAQAIASSKGNEDAIKASQIERERARADTSAADAARARADTAAAQQQADVSRMRAGMARADANEATQQAQAAKTQAAEATAQAASANSQAAIATAQAGDLQRQLSDLRAQSTERGMLVTLGDVLFAFGRADILPSAQESMRKLASWLQEHPERSVLIEGFTDSIGSQTANLTLSQRRAEAVASALAGQGIAASRIRAQGYGETHPVADNGTDSNRAMNRRVEVYISNDAQPVRSRS